MEYKLSIIIPVYNVEKYIADCLHSIFDQNAEDNYEIILVNDGTKDRSMEIAREICSGKPNVTIAEQENQGLSAARMRGLAEVKGEYVWFVDSDDWLTKDAIQVVIQTIIEYAPDVIVSPLLWIDDKNGKEIKVDINLQTPIQTNGKTYLQSHCPVTGIQRCIIKKELFNNPQLFFPKGLLHEDAYFGRVLFYFAKTVFVFNKQLYHYRIRTGSIMTQRSIRSSYDLVTNYRFLSDFSQKEVVLEDMLWFKRHVFLGTLAESYSISRNLFGKKSFRKFWQDNRKIIIGEYMSCRSENTMRKRILDLFYLSFPHLFSIIMGDIRHISFTKAK